MFALRFEKNFKKSHQYQSNYFATVPVKCFLALKIIVFVDPYK